MLRRRPPADLSAGLAQGCPVWDASARGHKPRGEGRAARGANCRHGSGAGGGRDEPALGAGAVCSVIKERDKIMPAVTARRLPDNPLITPADVPPSRPD